MTPSILGRVLVLDLSIHKHISLRLCHTKLLESSSGYFLHNNYYLCSTLKRMNQEVKITKSHLFSTATEAVKLYENWDKHNQNLDDETLQTVGILSLRVNVKHLSPGLKWQQESQLGCNWAKCGDFLENNFTLAILRSKKASNVYPGIIHQTQVIVILWVLMWALFFGWFYSYYKWNSVAGSLTQFFTTREMEVLGKVRAVLFLGQRLSLRNFAHVLQEITEFNH